MRKIALVLVMLSAANVHADVNRPTLYRALADALYINTSGDTLTGLLTANAATGIAFPGSTSGTATVKAPAVAGTAAITLPSASSTLPIFGHQMTFAGPTGARTVTFPDEAFTVMGLATTQTPTGKTISLANNTITGTTAQFNTALSDNDFATLAGTETLTNKTLTNIGGIGRHMTGAWYQVTTVAASQTDVALTSGAYPRGWIAARAGSVTAIVVNLASARTAGTITIIVQKSTDSGTSWSNIASCLAAISTNTTKGVATFTRGTHTFAANDMLRATVTTGAGWTPTSNTVDAAVEVELP